MHHHRHHSLESNENTTSTSHNSIQENAQSCARELAVFTTGAAIGALEQGKNRWKKDPTGVCLEAGSAAATGVAFALAAEAGPVVAGAMATIATANFLWNTTNSSAHRERNSNLAAAWEGTWKFHDQKHLNYYEKKIAQQIGNEVFDIAICTGFGTTGLCATELAASNSVARAFSRNASENALHATVKRPQLSGSPMRNFINGDSHALDRNRLSLTPNRSLVYESARLHPRTEPYPPISEYTFRIPRLN